MEVGPFRLRWELHTEFVAQLEVIEADDETREAVADWHYWVGMGYEF